MEENVPPEKEKKHPYDYISMTREDLLNDLSLLQRFYDLVGKEKMIHWILKTLTSEEINKIPSAYMEILKNDKNT